MRVSFEIDAANDGWFLEDDNRIVELDVDGSTSPRAHHVEGATLRVMFWPRDGPRGKRAATDAACLR